MGVPGADGAAGATAAGSPSTQKPTCRCVPSQSGFFAEWPQRQSEIGFPGLDASAKSSAILTVKISPERLTYADGDRSSLTYTEGKDQLSKQKKWLVSNFRFELDRFKSDRLNISKVEAFAIKHNVITNHVGSEREARKERR